MDFKLFLHQKTYLLMPLSMRFKKYHNAKFRKLEKPGIPIISLGKGFFCRAGNILFLNQDMSSSMISLNDNYLSWTFVSNTLSCMCTILQFKRLKKTPKNSSPFIFLSASMDADKVIKAVVATLDLGKLYNEASRAPFF